MGLMGENGAGKSTMMKCLFGTYQKDEGTIILDGKEVNFSGPKEALENGVAMVHQELNQCLERSVVDNLFLGRYPKNSMGVVDEGRMKKEASDLFRKLGITVNMTQPMKKMSVSQRQMCEIAKAISYNSKVIVLDEPTSSLTAPEVEKLFKMMRQLKEQGISLIYISHKMDEIFEICDQISVLRDGSLVMTKDSKDTDMNELISAMVGRSLDNRFPPVDNKPGEVIFSVENLSTKYAPKLQNISFDIRKGEIFGLLGPNGAGKSTTILMMLGLTEPTSGTVEICGINSTTHPIEVKRKIGYLPEDVGFYDDMTGPENLIYTARLNGIPDKEAKTKAMELMKRVGLEEQLTKKTGKYSRGMRQRLGLADVLIKNPEIIILDEPTSGIDPAGVQEFIELIRWLSKEEGLTVLFSSHHLDQVQKVCDRVGLFSNGQLLALIDMAELKDKKQELSDIYNHYFEEGGERHE